jgi:hypothetical protein
MEHRRRALKSCCRNPVSDTQKTEQKLASRLLTEFGIPGTDVAILKIFSQKNLRQKLPFLHKLFLGSFCKNLAKIADNCDHNIDFRMNGFSTYM